MSDVDHQAAVGLAFAKAKSAEKEVEGLKDRHRDVIGESRDSVEDCTIKGSPE